MKTAAFCFAFLASCVSDRVAFPTSPIGPEEQLVGHVEGSAGGFMLFGLLPIAQNSRFQRAYEAACQQATPGGRLVNVQCWESWYWAYIGNGYVFHVCADVALPLDPSRRPAPRVDAPPEPKDNVVPPPPKKDVERPPGRFDLLRRGG